MKDIVGEQRRRQRDTRNEVGDTLDLKHTRRRRKSHRNASHGWNSYDCHQRRIFTPTIFLLCWTFLVCIRAEAPPPSGISASAAARGPTKATTDRPTERKASRRKQQKPSSSTKTISSKRMSLLRIQREWKDAIHAGIAFDWRKGEPVLTKKQRQLNTDSTNNTTRPSSSHVWIGPLDDRYGLFIWHFTVTGLSNSVFENGVYHGRVVLPLDYPATPPRVQMLTPSGRFIPGADICLSASQHHPETWQPNAWSVRTLVESLRLHMCSSGMLEIGGMAESYEQRLAHAIASRRWTKQIGVTARVDHGRMIDKGYLPRFSDKHEDDNEIESDACKVETIVLEDPVSMSNHSNVICSQEPRNESLLERVPESPGESSHGDISIENNVSQKKKKKKRKKKAKSDRQSKQMQQPDQGRVTAYDDPLLLQLMRAVCSNRLSMGLFAFFVLFCFLNMT